MKRLLDIAYRYLHEVVIFINTRVLKQEVKCVIKTRKFVLQTMNKG